MSTTEHITAGFPLELLSRSRRERREYFNEYTVLHTRLKAACGELLSAILDAPDASLIFLAGPTGVGKTTLIRFLEARLTRHLFKELEEDRGRLPYVTFEVPAPESSLFPWKDLYRRALSAMAEPFIEYKTEVPLPPGHDLLFRVSMDKIAMSKLDKGTQGIRRALESVLRHRRPLVAILDEGQHLMKITSGRKLRDQLDLIKSLANISGVPHLLIGTYDLIAFLNLSGQLSRRSVVVHLPRYQATILDDIKVYASVVRAFQQHMPLVEEPDLLAQVEYLYERSIGCVGVLKSWLDRAFNLALEEGAQTLTLEHLEKCAFTSAQCRRMLTEAREGEAKLADDDSESTRLREELGMPSMAAASSVTNPPDDGRGVARRQRPFQRKPGRDPVGRKDDDAP